MELPNLSRWRELVQRVLTPHQQVRIAVVGKYTEYADSYKSVLEALIHGGIANDVGVEVNWISSEAFTNRDTAGTLLSGYDGLLVPGGFGVRGVEGMVEAIRSARETGLPFLGICLGMQTAIIEFARNVCHLEDSHSSEFEPECDNAVISLMESQQHVTDMGGTMRLGAYPCRLARGSRAAEVYGVPEVSERHRHRYEVSNRYRDLFVQNGMRLSGLSPDGQLVEIIELQAHPWFIGCQFHPELQSRPTRPHPLFADAKAEPGSARWSKQQTDAAMVRFRSDALFLIAGPCVLESDALNMRVGDHLARLAEHVPGGIIYKASFDKANRSNKDAARGPGLDDGLAALARVRERTGLPVLTDVHLPEQCAPAAQVVDVLQIPAFLCRQTDLLVAAGATGKPVNIKKGQWLHPEGMKGAVDKVRGALGDPGVALNAQRSTQIALTERGTFFGYGDLVVDMRNFARMRAACDVPLIFDATHSVQQPGKGVGGASGGAREFIPPLARAAVAAGADGLFMETHPDPDHAPSDGPNMIPLDKLDALVERLIQLWDLTRR